MYQCDHCNFKSERMWCVNRHTKSKHEKNQTGSGVVQNAHQTAGQNMHQTQEVNACIRQWQEAYQNIGARYKQSEKEKAELIQYCNAQSSRAPTTVSVGPDCSKAPTTVSVPPLGSTNQYGDGVGMDMDNESVDEDEEITPDVMDILTDISATFTYLKHLRKQYRESLPQIKEFDDKEMDEFLEYYS